MNDTGTTEMPRPASRRCLDPHRRIGAECFPDAGDDRIDDVAAETAVERSARGRVMAVAWPNELKYEPPSTLKARTVIPAAWSDAIVSAVDGPG